jgi:hypothetical protein
VDTGFIDLDILLTKIRNAQSKIYFLDTVKTYKAGALRASMTSVWVALVYDLIAKYRELSAMGDAAATTFITAWDNTTAAADIGSCFSLRRIWITMRELSISSMLSPQTSETLRPAP